MDINTQLGIVSAIGGLVMFGILGHMFYYMDPIAVEEQLEKQLKKEKEGK